MPSKALFRSNQAEIIWGRVDSLRSDNSTETADGCFAGKRGVAFSEKVEVIEIEKHSDLPKDIHEALWFTPEEWDEIKADYMTLIYLVENKISFNKAKQSFRGLEAKTEEGAWESYSAQKASRHVVLDEQDRQTENHDNCASRIAKLHKKQSKKHRKEALERAQEDLRQALKVYLEFEEKYCLP